MASAVNPRRRRALTAVLLLGTFLASIEVTVVATAMPSIVGQLGGLEFYPWVFSAYLLAQTVSIPLYGRLADLIGRRMTYLGGVVLFLTGALLCGMAPSMQLLVAARALQGLGAGSVLPVTQTIFGDLYEVSARTKLQGLFSLVWGVSSVAGPLVGGTIVAHWTWPWVFWINLPIGIVSATAVGLLLKEQPTSRRPRLDLGGALTLSAATILLLLATLPAAQRPLSIPWWGWILAAVLFGALFLRIQNRHPEPLVPLDLFHDRVQVAANASGVLMGVVLFGVISYLPLYIQEVRGGTPMQAGALLIPLSLGWTSATLIGGRVVRRVGFQLLVRLGSLSLAAGAVVGVAGMEMGWNGVALLGEIAYGVGMGLCISSFVVSIQARVTHERRGIATALSQFSRSIGGAVGVALLGGLMTATAGADLRDLSELSCGPETIASLTRGLRMIFLVLAGVAVLAMVLAVTLFPHVDEGMTTDDQGHDG
jgi:EmrB/QacA subfamily drug resistance transporter